MKIPSRRLSWMKRSDWQRTGDERILSRLASVHMLIDLRAGDFAAARHRLHDSLQQVADRGDHHWPTWLPMLAAVLHQQGLEVWSARFFVLVEVMTEIRPISAEAAALGQLARLGDIRAEVRAQLGDEAFARETAAGQRLTVVICGRSLIRWNPRRPILPQPPAQP